MKYRSLPVTPFAQNCSVLWCPQTHSAAVVDPGGDLDAILSLVANEKVEVESVLLTHAHIDHAGGARRLADQLRVPLVGPHQADAFWLDAMSEQSQMFGFPAVAPFRPDRWLDQGDQVTVGKVVLDVLHCPGHTPGHVVFYQPQVRRAFVGDVLFKGSIGRTDFPRGNHAELIASIMNKLLPLGDDVIFIPGHGPESRLGHERLTNPYLQG